MNLVKKIMWGLLMLSGIAIMIISSAVFNVSPSLRDRTMAWFMENLFAVISLVMITFAVIFLGIDEYKRTNEEYKAAEEDIKKFIKLEYRPTVWTKFKNYINPIRKINQYQEVLRVQLHNLEFKAKEEDLILYDSTREEDQDKKLTNPYCMKRKYLEDRSNEKWLRANIKHIKVTYDEIDINVVVSGSFPKNSNKVRQVNEFVTKGKGWKLFRSRIPIIVLITGIFMFVSSMILQFEFGVTFWANTGIKIMSMAWNIFIAIRFKEEWNQTVTLTDIMFQDGMVKEYRNYVKRELKSQGLNPQGGDDSDA